MTVFSTVLQVSATTRVIHGGNVIATVSVGEKEIAHFQYYKTPEAGWYELTLASTHSTTYIATVLFAGKTLMDAVKRTLLRHGYITKDTELAPLGEIEK